MNTLCISMGIKKFYTCAVKRKLISLHISDERNNCRPKRILVQFIRSATKRIRVKYNVSQRKRTIYRQKVYTQVLYLYDIIYIRIYIYINRYSIYYVAYTFSWDTRTLIRDEYICIYIVYRGYIFDGTTNNMEWLFCVEY